MYCESCGYENSEGRTQCERCGHILGKPVKTDIVYDKDNSEDSHQGKSSSKGKKWILLSVLPIIAILMFGIPFISGSNQKAEDKANQDTEAEKPVTYEDAKLSHDEAKASNEPIFMKDGDDYYPLYDQVVEDGDLYHEKSSLLYTPQGEEKMIPVLKSGMDIVSFNDLSDEELSYVPNKIIRTGYTFPIYFSERLNDDNEVYMKIAAIYDVADFEKYGSNETLEGALNEYNGQKTTTYAELSKVANVERYAQDPYRPEEQECLVTCDKSDTLSLVAYYDNVTPIKLTNVPAIQYLITDKKFDVDFVEPTELHAKYVPTGKDYVKLEDTNYSNGLYAISVPSAGVYLFEIER